MEVELVAGVAWFAGDEEAQWSCFGWRRFRSFPAAKERGNSGEMANGLLRF